MDTLEELLRWLLEENGSVGILGINFLLVHTNIVDATNSTVARRKMILERVHQIEDLNVLFIESICTDKKVAQHRFYSAHCLVDFGEQYET
jgi:hypothetical protein